jgi:hypothetical protein
LSPGAKQFYESITAATFPGFAQTDEEARVVAYLLHPYHRKHVALLAYSLTGEWQQSLLESHPDSTQRAQIITNHQKDFELLQAYFAKYLPFIKKTFPSSLGLSACSPAMSA